jgi:hypothetical protein
MDYLMKIRERAFFMELILDIDELKEYLQGKSNLSKQSRKFIKLMLLEAFTDCLRISKEIFNLSNQGILQNTQQKENSNFEEIEADRELGESEGDNRGSDEATEDCIDTFSDALEEDKVENFDPEFASNPVTIETSIFPRCEDSEEDDKE